MTKAEAIAMQMDTVEALYLRHRDRGDAHFAEALAELLDELSVQHLEALGTHVYDLSNADDAAAFAELQRTWAAEPDVNAAGGEC